tara:strand:+ start:10868 stop:11446 length:579 start_codon:yes stop_codon:yes gene_type:complete
MGGKDTLFILIYKTRNIFILRIKERSLLMNIFGENLQKMKIILHVLLTFALFSCSSNENTKNNFTFYGTEISNDSILNFIIEKEIVLKQGLKPCKLKGEIVETCSKKGCWMTLDTGEDTLFIKFRDYGFFVPVDSVEGKTAVIQGDLFLDTTSVEMLKHYAEDAGKSEEEIALITEPSFELGFIADGVIIKE